MDARYRAADGLAMRPVAALAALALVGLLGACSHGRHRGSHHAALSPQEHVRLGAAYEAQGMRVDALAQFDAAVLADPSYAEGWLALGNSAFVDGRHKDAEAFFRKALQADPHHAGAANNLAMTLLEQDSPAEAEVFAAEALPRAGPLEPYVLDTLARIRLRQKRYNDAAALIDRAVAATPASDAFVREQLLATRGSIETAASADGAILPAPEN